MREKIKKLIFQTVKTDDVNFNVEIPKEKKFGDYSTNIALVLSKRLKKKPIDLANEIKANLANSQFFKQVEIAPPGFINFFIKEEVFLDLFREIHTKKKDFFKINIGNNMRVLLEFVSANPTGPLHIGHGRGAVVGDVLSNLLKFTGFNVLKEYYINDAGNQMNILGNSIRLRVIQLIKGEKSVQFPEDHYKGEYIIEIAKEILEKYGESVLEKDVNFFTEYGVKKILPQIIEDLRIFGVEFDNFFSEKSLFEKGEVEDVLKELNERGYLYEKDGALWLKVEGDEDRVVKRSDGTYTYFASDIAYHKNKYERGFDLLIDIWGADHHGYIPRIKSAIKALGLDQEKLKIILVQMVNLLRGGKKVKLSTRAGEFVTLKELVDEVGKDAVRFIFMTRKSDAHLDFDIEVAKLKTNENPVYYVQYAHARICSILRNCDTVDEVQKFSNRDEIELIKKVDDLKHIIKVAAKNLEPHLLTYYLIELAGLFHSFYNKHKVIGNKTRVALVKCVKEALKLGLDLLGVEAPEKM